MVRQFAMIVRESSYGVTMTSPVKGVDKHYIPLNAPNAVSLSDRPIVGKLSHGGGYAIDACAYSDQSQAAGQIQTQLFPGAYGMFLLDWGITPINAGRTLPWATTDANYLMPPGDLASCSVYLANELPDGTYKRRKFTGCKVLSGNLSASRQSPVWALSLQVQGIKEVATDAIEFPEPGDGDFPCGPYTFSDLEGGLKIATVRQSYGSVAFAWTNAMAPQWFESRSVQLIKYCGRKSTLDANLYMKPSPDDEASLKALTSLDSALVLDNGAYTTTISLPNALWETLTPDLPLDDVFAWNGQLAGLYDATAKTDVVVSGAEVDPGD